MLLATLVVVALVCSGSQGVKSLASRKDLRSPQVLDSADSTADCSPYEVSGDVGSVRLWASGDALRTSD